VKIEGQLAWEKENSKRYDISKSTSFNTWKKNANIEKIDFKVSGEYEIDKKNKVETFKGIDKKNKVETSKGKEKAEEYKKV